MSSRKFLAEKVLWDQLNPWKKTTPDMHRVSFLKTVPFFNELKHWQLKKVAEIVFERRYEANEVVFEQGQPGAALFLIVDGQVSVEFMRDNIQTHLTVLESGAFFGEMALLDDSPRSASARCLTVTNTLALYRNDLNRLVQTDPLTSVLIFQALARVVGDRLRSTNELVWTGLQAEKMSA